MGGIYAYLIDAGWQAAYLDNCTIYDLDLNVRQTNKLQKKRGPSLF